MISVVVTLYNESGSLGELYRRTVEALETLGEPFEIIFVDDGSTDGSFAELERLASDGPPCAGRALPAQLRPASGDARRSRACPRATSS